MRVPSENARRICRMPNKGLRRQSTGVQARSIAAADASVNAGRETVRQSGLPGDNFPGARDTSSPKPYFLRTPPSR